MTQPAPTVQGTLSSVGWTDDPESGKGVYGVGLGNDLILVSKTADDFITWVRLDCSGVTPSVVESDTFDPGGELAWSGYTNRDTLAGFHRLDATHALLLLCVGSGPCTAVAYVWTVGSGWDAGTVLSSAPATSPVLSSMRPDGTGGMVFASTGSNITVQDLAWDGTSITAGDSSVFGKDEVSDAGEELVNYVDGFVALVGGDFHLLNMNWLTQVNAIDGVVSTGLKGYTFDSRAIYRVKGRSLWYESGGLHSFANDRSDELVESPTLVPMAEFDPDSSIGIGYSGPPYHAAFFDVNQGTGVITIGDPALDSWEDATFAMVPLADITKFAVVASGVVALYQGDVPPPPTPDIDAGPVKQSRIRFPG